MSEAGVIDDEPALEEPGLRGGARYTARVKEIRPQEPGSGYRHVILVRDGDHAEVRSFSDAVTVLREGE